MRPNGPVRRSLAFLPIVLASAFEVGCGDVSAFGPRKPGSPCHPGHGSMSTGYVDGGVAYTTCIDSKTVNYLVTTPIWSDVNRCGDSIFHLGAGSCLEFCDATTSSDPPTQWSLASICLIDPPVPTSTRTEPYTSDWPGGCQAMIDSSPNNGDPCTGDGWGCLGMDFGDEPTAPSVFLGAWCNQGTLLVIPDVDILIPLDVRFELTPLPPAP